MLPLSQGRSLNESNSASLAVQQQEKVLGTDHVNTLQSRYQLAVTLHSQRIYGEAEQLLRQLVQQRERLLGTKHVETLKSKY
jgi:hypothetical protein